MGTTNGAKFSVSGVWLSDGTSNVKPDPNGNRAERRKAKKLGIKKVCNNDSLETVQEN